jgi:SagB-type dehydrogenase family enzyme
MVRVQPSEATIDLGEEFLESSSYHPLLAARLRPRLEVNAEPDFVRGEGRPPDVILKPEVETGRVTATALSEALKARRTDRSYTGEAIKIGELAHLVHGALGVGTGAPAHRGRAYPSGGAMYPIGAYLLVRNVSGLAPGTYRVRADGNLHNVVAVAPNQLIWRGFFSRQASLVVMLVAQLDRPRLKYGVLAYRLALIEAGHIAQNYLLIATTLHIKAAPMCNFPSDDTRKALLLRTLKSFPLYAIEMGR